MMEPWGNHIWYFVWRIQFHCKSHIDIVHLKSSETISGPYRLYHNATIFVIICHGLRYHKPLRIQEIHQQHIPPFLKILRFHPIKP